MAADYSLLVGILLAVLLSLAGFDIWTQHTVRELNYWRDWYSFTVKTNGDYWKVGFKIEDLEIKVDTIASQLERYKSIIDPVLASGSFRLTQESSSPAGAAMLSRHEKLGAFTHLLPNVSNMYNIHCDGFDAPVRVGINDFQTEENTACHLYLGDKRRRSSPHYIFEVVDLGDDAIAIRSIATGNFLRAIPAASDAWENPWELVVGGPSIGAYERLRKSEDGFLYSSLLKGLCQCSSEHFVRGYSDKYGSYSHFVLKPIEPDEYAQAMELIDLSNQLIIIQSQSLDKHEEAHREEHKREKEPMSLTFLDAQSPFNMRTIKIAIVMPITSKGTLMESVSESPLWPNFFDSFMKSIDWRSNRYCFCVFLGFDKRDDIYDTGDAWSEMREEFKKRAVFRMKEQLMDDIAINSVLRDTLTLKLMHFDDLAGAPSQIVSQLVVTAYSTGFDYFYQVNDDTIIISPNWATVLINNLYSNPLIHNFGVTGPTDLNNNRIFTHVFFHRTHVEIFGYLFPPYFKNWWSDDWVSTVYGAEHTFRSPNVEIRHNVESQKVVGFTRYQVDFTDRLHLDDELRLGHVKIDRWLKKNGLPRLPLPNVCGYIPLVVYLKDALRSKHQTEQHQHIIGGGNNMSNTTPQLND